MVPKIFDVEATNLLNSESIDYTASPYKLREDFEIHCAVFIDLDTKDVDTFDPKTIHKLPKYAKQVDHIIGHNIINYDLLALKLYYGMDYSVNPDSWVGRDCKIEDTLIISKTLNPDRWFGHSLGDWGRFLKFDKIDWRGKAIELGLIPKNAPKGAEFKVYHPAMLDYCVRDAEVNVKTYEALQEEIGDWDWEEALGLEHSSSEIITRQEHRGFWFHTERAEKNLVELDRRMLSITEKVEPLIPPKKLTKAQEKEYSFGKQIFKKDGSLCANFKKWLTNNNAEVIYNEKDKVVAVKWGGVTYPKLPVPSIESPEYATYHPFYVGAVIDVLPASLKDGTHIKEWLVGLGWHPSTFKDKDITVDSKKKKKTKEKYEKSIQLYIDQTLSSNFKKFRFEALEVHTESEFRKKLYNHDMKKPLKVLTNPQFSIGQDKTICPNLERIKTTFPYTKEVIEWLTYNHRRNSILGGGLRFDEGEVAEKGFLSVDRIRQDNRIPTSADTMGASSGRLRHRMVANIPRATSLFGEEMRAMFGCDPSMYQLGSDFVSVEAMVESHYCKRYKGGEQYAVALVAEKPNSIHCATARKLDISRADAKTLKYSCLPVRGTEVLTKDGWRYYSELTEGDTILSYNTEKDCVENDSILKLHYFEDEEVINYTNKLHGFSCTEDHRWFTWKRKRQRGKGQEGLADLKTYEFVNAEDLNTEHNIILAAEREITYGGVTKEDAALMAWILSDGSYKWSEDTRNTSSSQGEKRAVVCSIDQATHKYVDEVRLVLKEAKVEWNEFKSYYNEDKEIVKFKLTSPSARDFLDRVAKGRLGKHEYDWSKWVLSLSTESREAFVYNFWLADGATKNSDYHTDVRLIKQNRGEIADAITLALFLQGRRVLTSGNKCSTIRQQKQRHLTCQKLEKTSRGKQEVFCLTTNNSTFIVRQGDFIGITGNCTYGAQPATIAKQMGWTVARARQVYNGFWREASPLKDLKENLTRYWKTVGEKKYILGLDGRKVPTRSEHSLLNNLFQSAGAIAAKRQMIMFDRKLAEEGLLCDFFKDDWRNMLFVQQMIFYHDELQHELHRSLVKFKYFDTEDEAKEYKSNGFMLSNVGHDEKGYYRAYSKVGEWMRDLAGEASEYYNMKVRLKMDYDIGCDWLSTH